MKNTCTPPCKGKQALKGFKCLIAMLFISAISLAQPGQKWATGGNANGAGDFLGTTNNQSIDFKTNNTLKMVLGTDGTLKLINLAGNGSRMLQTDASGKLTAFAAGNATDVLYGNGTWGSLPVTPTSWNIVGNNIVAVNTGNVGIGTNNPQYKLHVVGDAYVSNNLYVGGGIIVTDQLKAAEYVTTGRLTADTIKMGAGRVIDGTTKVAGDFYVAPTRTLTAGGDIMANSKLTVAGNATFNGVLKATQGIMFDNTSGIAFKIVNGVAVMGGAPNAINDPPTPGANPCFIPTLPAISAVMNTPQAFQVYSSASSAGAYTPGESILTIISESTKSKIISTGGGSNGQLDVNVDCGQNVNICTGTAGGKVTMGNFVSMGNFVKMNRFLEMGPATGIGSGGYATAAFNINMQSGSAMEVKALSNFVKAYSIQKSGNYVYTVMGDGKTIIGNNGSLFNDVSNTMLSLNVTNTETPFEIYNTTASNSVFKIDANGKTQIGTQTQAAGTTHANALFTVYGKAVATEVIVTQQNWADYVFAKTYKLNSLEYLESYIKENKHLPNIPSAKEVKEQGVSLGEMSKLQMEKIEELTLYVIELKKELQALKKVVKDK